MSTRAFRFVSTDRFVVGKGRFAADIAAAGTWQVALVTCLHPAASTRRKRWPSPPCVLPARRPRAGGGAAAAGWPNTPKMPRRPLAVEVARYAGEWVAAVVADTHALAEDAAELGLPGAASTAKPPPRPASGRARRFRLQHAARPHLCLGRGREGFCRKASSPVTAPQMGRSSTAPVETFAAATVAAALLSLYRGMHLRPSFWGHHGIELNQGLEMVERERPAATTLNHDALGLHACSTP
jgi:hypothetical protein